MENSFNTINQQNETLNKLKSDKYNLTNCLNVSVNVANTFCEWGAAGMIIIIIILQCFVLFLLHCAPWRPSLLITPTDSPSVSYLVPDVRQSLVILWFWMEKNIMHTFFCNFWWIKADSPLILYFRDKSGHNVF